MGTTAPGPLRIEEYWSGGVAADAAAVAGWRIDPGAFFYHRLDRIWCGLVLAWAALLALKAKDTRFTVLACAAGLWVGSLHVVSSRPLCGRVALTGVDSTNFAALTGVLSVAAALLVAAMVRRPLLPLLLLPLRPTSASELPSGSAMHPHYRSPAPIDVHLMSGSCQFQGTFANGGTVGGGGTPRSWSTSYPPWSDDSEAWTILGAKRCPSGYGQWSAPRIVADGRPLSALSSLPPKDEKGGQTSLVITPSAASSFPFSNADKSFRYRLRLLADPPAPGLPGGFGVGRAQSGEGAESVSASVPVSSSSASSTSSVALRHPFDGLGVMQTDNRGTYMDYVPGVAQGGVLRPWYTYREVPTEGVMDSHTTLYLWHHCRAQPEGVTEDPVAGYVLRIEVWDVVTGEPRLPIALPFKQFCPRFKPRGTAPGLAAILFLASAALFAASMWFLLRCGRTNGRTRGDASGDPSRGAGSGTKATGTQGTQGTQGTPETKESRETPGMLEAEMPTAAMPSSVSASCCTSRWVGHMVAAWMSAFGVLVGVVAMLVVFVGDTYGDYDDVGHIGALECLLSNVRSNGYIE